MKKIFFTILIATTSFFSFSQTQIYSEGECGTVPTPNQNFLTEPEINSSKFLVNGTQYVMNVKGLHVININLTNGETVQKTLIKQ